MLLAIDIGNTNTVFAAHDGQNFVAEWRCRTAADRTADEYFVWLRSLMAHAGLEIGMVSAAAIASVVPDATNNLRVLSKRYFGSTALVVGDSDCRAGIALRVDRPSAVGADRIANAVGAGVSYGTDLVVVDFGTATTFDVIDGDGAYAGGVIAPGIRMSLAALHAAAARLPRVEVERPALVIGTDTVPAMQSGVYWGYVSLIDGVCELIRRERRVPMRVIATGGLAPLFERDCRTIETVDLQLTIRGLVEIHRRSRGMSE